MFAKIFVTLALLAVSCSAGVAPVAPVVAPATAYVNTVPYNVPPYASSVNIVNRGLASPYVAASPYAAPYAAHYAAPYAAPYVAAPYTAAAAPYVAAASYPYASYPYAAPYVTAPLLK